MTDELLTNPHLEGLIRLAETWERQADDPAFPDEDERPIIEAEDAICRLHASQLRQALAALPGGGVEELVEAAEFASNVLAETYAKYQTKIGPFASQSQVANGKLRAAIKRVNTPTPSPHEADRNGNR